MIVKTIKDISRNRSTLNALATQSLNVITRRSGRCERVAVRPISMICLAGWFVIMTIVTVAGDDVDRTETVKADSPIARRSPLVDSHDLNGDYARHLFRVRGARVWTESANGLDCRYWSSVDDNVDGEIFYRYQFAGPTTAGTIHVNMHVHIPGDHNRLDVSADGRNWTTLHDITKRTGNSQTPDLQFELPATVLGGRSLWVRVIVSGRQLNTTISTGQFLRTIGRHRDTSRPGYRLVVHFDSKTSSETATTSSDPATISSDTATISSDTGSGSAVASGVQTDSR